MVVAHDGVMLPPASRAPVLRLPRPYTNWSVGSVELRSVCSDFERNRRTVDGLPGVLVRAIVDSSARLAGEREYLVDETVRCGVHIPPATDLLSVRFGVCRTCLIRNWIADTRTFERL